MVSAAVMAEVEEETVKKVATRDARIVRRLTRFSRMLVR